LKIIKRDDSLVIPIIGKIDLAQIKSDLNMRTPLKLVHDQFEIRKKRYTSISEILKGKIPSELLEIQPVAFDQVGSIAVVDLKDGILEYKEIIGEAIIEFNPSVTTVFRKSKAVSGVKRLRGLELIAGTETYETVHKEYGIKIFVNVKDIYFSPRLSTEHRRIAEQVNQDDIVLDMFGAAGPFALHITSIRKAIVYTLDINEFAKEIVSKSINLNPNLKGEIRILSGDVIIIAQQLIHDNLEFDHVIMNHPSEATNYLYLADKLVKKGGFIHVYSFVQIKKHDDICHQIISQELQGYEIVNITNVRQYSPQQYHTCITIKKL
ncbi:MAG: class I SAM-dependent methyltransferase family protein, partial [Candidatus Heimdallarchaeota archaeon]